MASLAGINILALTDHNSTKNCPAFFEAAERYDIIPIAGMELTTSEDIHLVCLFENLEDALDFDKFLEDIDLVVIMVNHNQIKENMDKLKGKIVFDTRKCCDLPGTYRL